MFSSPATDSTETDSYMMCNCSGPSVLRLKGLTCGFTTGGTCWAFMKRHSISLCVAHFSINMLSFQFAVPGCPQNAETMGTLYEAARIECRFGNNFVTAAVTSSVSVCADQE